MIIGSRIFLLFNRTINVGKSVSILLKVKSINSSEKDDLSRGLFKESVIDASKGSFIKSSVLPWKEGLILL